MNLNIEKFKMFFRFAKVKKIALLQSKLGLNIQ